MRLGLANAADNPFFSFAVAIPLAAIIHPQPLVASKMVEVLVSGINLMSECFSFTLDGKKSKLFDSVFIRQQKRKDSEGWSSGWGQEDDNGGWSPQKEKSDKAKKSQKQTVKAKKDDNPLIDFGDNGEATATSSKPAKDKSKKTAAKSEWNSWEDDAWESLNKWN